MAEESAPVAPEGTRLRDLRASEVPVAILARIVTIRRREVVRRSDGGRRPVLSGLLSDGTATVRFTWWDPPTEEIERGTIVRAAPVTVREFRGRPELSFGWRTRVVPASAAELPELPADAFVPRRVVELEEGSEGFALEARVVEVEPKSVSVGAERRELHEGVLEDASGHVGFTAWSDFRLRVGEALRIEGAYVRSFRGRPQLVLDERARVDRIDGAGLPAPGPEGTRLTERIGRWDGSHGDERATIVGRALAVQPPSGLVLRCPNCSRTVRAGLCRSHGPVTGVPDLRLRLVLDDGTGVVTVNLDRAQTERITETTLDACRALMAARADPSAVEGELFGRVFGRRFRARGPLGRDDFGLSMFAREVAPAAAEDPSAEADLRARLARDEER
jgi:ssDNA-binding replication factor A large subunit